MKVRAHVEGHKCVERRRRVKTVDDDDIVDRVCRVSQDHEAHMPIYT